MRLGKGKIRMCMLVAVTPWVLSACGNPSEGTENSDKTENAAFTAETRETVQGTEEKEQGAEPTESARENQIKITVGDSVFTATLEKNSSADALKELGKIYNKNVKR